MLLALYSRCSNILERLVIVDDEDGEFCVCVHAEALGDMSLCYILDGILIAYGIVLTILYSRLRVRHTNTHTTMFKVTVVSKGGVQDHYVDNRRIIYNNSFTYFLY